MNTLLTLEDEKVLSIKGATKVVMATLTQSIILTEKKQINISGNNIEVKKLDIENGLVILSGDFINFKFVIYGGGIAPLTSYHTELAVPMSLYGNTLYYGEFGWRYEGESYGLFRFKKAGSDFFNYEFEMCWYNVN